MSLTKRAVYFYALFFLLAIVISTVIAISMFEIYARLNHERFHSYGWVTDNITQAIIDKCEDRYGKQKVSIVLGDSFAEFYGDKESNLVKQLSQQDNNHNYCNFGISGTGPAVYKKRLDAIFQSKQLNVDRVIVFLYEGNDFSDYLLKDQIDTGTNDRKQTLTMNFIKGSYALNFIYREIIKRYTSSEIEPLELIKTVNVRDIDEQIAMDIFSKTPKDLLQKFKSNLLNVSWYSVALSMPNYFKRIHTPVESEFKIQKDVTMRPIDQIISMAKIHGAHPIFFIIPHDYFLFDIAKHRWSETFRFEVNADVIGPSKLTNYLTSNYDNFYYPSGIFSFNDFILDDGHLTYSGNNKLARFCISKMSGN